MKNKDAQILDVFVNAKIAYGRLSSQRNTAQRIERIAKLWGDIVVKDLKTWGKIRPSDFPSDTKGLLVAGFFFGSTDEGKLVAYATFVGGDFRPKGIPLNVNFIPQNIWVQTWPWPRNKKFQIGYGGSEGAGVSEFLQHTTQRAIDANNLLNQRIKDFPTLDRDQLSIQARSNSLPK